MSLLVHWYPGDHTIEFFVAVALGVALLSSVGWLVARRLARRPAARHLVLFAALSSCLGLPALVIVSIASSMVIVSIPILRSEQAKTEFRVDQPALAGGSVPEQRWDHPFDQRPVDLTTTAPSRNARTDRSEPTAASVPIRVEPASTPRAADAGPTDRSVRFVPSFQAIATLAVFVWVVVVVFMLACLARSGWCVMQLRRSTRPVPADSLPHLLAEVSRELGVVNVPQIGVLRRAIAPVAVGFGRPMIVLPEQLIAMLSSDEMRDVLVHEVAHIRRRDHLIVVVQGLARALYWPIVPVHGLNRELQRAREELCDNVVLANRDGLHYGETLLHIAELLVDGRTIGATVGILNWRGELERRIAGLLDPTRNKLTRTSRRLAWITMLLFVAVGAIASTTRFGLAVRAAEAPVARAPSEMRSNSRVGVNAEVSAIQKPSAPLDPAAPELPGRFSGRVIGPDGKPVSRARVFIAPDNPKLKDIGPVRTLTGADGHFEFDAPDMIYNELDGLPARRQGLLIATSQGLASDWVVTWGRNHASFRSHWDPIKGADLTLQLATDDVPIHGRFLDPEGRPLTGARVRLVGLMVPLKHDLSAHLDREAKRSEVSMTDYAREIHRLQVLPGLTTETLTDADGRFKLSGLGRDRLALLRVSAPSVMDTTVTVMTRDAPDAGIRKDTRGNFSQSILGAGFNLQLKRGLTVTGVVRDRESHAPIPGMWVGERGDAFNGLTDGEYPWSTDANGRFRITGLHPALAGQDVTAVPQPGTQYLAASAVMDGAHDVVIECTRGIPFHLQLKDEQGRPVDALVTYQDIHPNPHLTGLKNYDARWPVDRAARRPDGTYEGFVLPGPGAVLVKTPRGFDYRPAHVDPKAFFAPGRTNWTVEEQFLSYGTQDTLSIFAGWWTDQHDYAAIVLVNPPVGSKPLELSAIVAQDKPRRVSLIDPEGKPIVGARTQGLTFHPWDSEPPLRTASFLLRALHPDRMRRITFFKEDRKLIGFLAAKGDGDAPYTVQMQPWGTLTGRIVDERGKPFSAQGPAGKQQESVSLSMGGSPLVQIPDPEVGELPGVTTDANGGFRIEKLVPGLRYSARVYGGHGSVVQMAFENVVVRHGEVRDLGDVRTKPIADVPGK